MFFDRESIIENFTNKLKFFIDNKWDSTSHLVFLWLRRTWKTMLINHLLNKFVLWIKTVYIDISTINISPKKFW